MNLASFLTTMRQSTLVLFAVVFCVANAMFLEDIDEMYKGIDKVYEGRKELVTYSKGFYDADGKIGPSRVEVKKARPERFYWKPVKKPVHRGYKRMPVKRYQKAQLRRLPKEIIDEKLEGYKH